MVKNIELQNATSSFAQGQVIYTDKTISYVSTKRKEKSGSWYAELTRVNGNGYQYFGVKNDCGAVGFYLEGNVAHPMIFANGCLMRNSINRYRAPWQSTNMTFGIGADIDNSKFSIYDEQNYFTYTFPKLEITYKYNFFLVGGTVNDVFDNSIINFGASPFTYSKHGYKPWQESLFICSHRCSRSRKINFLFFVAISLNS